jgi:hypothetical protein
MRNAGNGDMGGSGGSISLPKWALRSIGLFLLPAVLTLLWWLVSLPAGWLFGKGSGHRLQRWSWYTVVKGDFFPHGFNIFHATIWFWILVAVWAIAMMVLVYDAEDPSKASTAIGWIVAAALLVTSVPMMIYSVRNNAMAEASYYNQYNVAVVDNPKNMSSTLNLLVHDQGTHAQPNSSGCIYLRTGDSPACIQQGEMPENWVARNASAEAAAVRLEKTSNGAANTTVLDSSLTYLYENGGVWTAIRDGKNAQPLDRIEMWNGKDDVTSCVFSGKYAVKGAFGGNYSNNLKSTLAKAYPSMFYDMNDVWGYCNGDEPVVVIPVTQQLGYGNRTVMKDAGVLILRGDNGRLNVSHVANPTYGTDLSKGQLPGPSYPLSLVQNARNSFGWAAGRRNNNRFNFGYQPTDDTAQYGNASEYLLKNTQTGELDWVTPLTTKSSSQEFIAWSVTPAGAAHSGILNPTKIYVLSDNDPRRVNILTLKGAARNALSQLNPGFFSAGGEIVEFLPVRLGSDTTGNTGMWQAYGELNSQVVYRLDIPTTAGVAPTVYSLQNGSQATGTPATTTPSTGANTVPSARSDCAKTPSVMSAAQLQACVNADLAELVQRANQVPTASSPTPVPSSSTK